MWKGCTCLTREETLKILNIGFISEGMQPRVPCFSSTTLCNICSASRGDGRTIKWKEKTNKASQDSITKARFLKIEIMCKIDVLY